MLDHFDFDLHLESETQSVLNVTQQLKYCLQFLSRTQGTRKNEDSTRLQLPIDIPEPNRFNRLSVLSGDFTYGEILVPIPNTIVKPVRPMIVLQVRK